MQLSSAMHRHGFDSVYFLCICPCFTFIFGILCLCQDKMVQPLAIEDLENPTWKEASLQMHPNFSEPPKTHYMKPLFLRHSPTWWRGKKEAPAESETAKSEGQVSLKLFQVSSKFFEVLEALECIYQPHDHLFLMCCFGPRI